MYAIPHAVTCKSCSHTKLLLDAVTHAVSLSVQMICAFTYFSNHTGIPLNEVNSIGKTAKDPRFCSDQNTFCRIPHFISD